MQHIKFIGIELEGGYHTKGPGDQGWHNDGSVDVKCKCYGPETYRTPYKQGEVVSKPMPVNGVWEEWLAYNHPEHTDESCGLHVHMSFIDESDYSRLMYPDFWEYFHEAWVKWGMANCPRDDEKNELFWHRLEGNNTYCKRSFVPERQWQDTSKGSYRYTQLNFAYSVQTSDPLPGTAEADIPEPVYPRCNCCCDLTDYENDMVCDDDTCQNTIRMHNECECNDLDDDESDCECDDECTSCYISRICSICIRHNNTLEGIRRVPFVVRPRKTLECRLLPMFDENPELAISAIWHLISLVNTFLDTCVQHQFDFDVEEEEAEYRLHLVEEEVIDLRCNNAEYMYNLSIETGDLCLAV